MAGEQGGYRVTYIIFSIIRAVIIVAAVWCFAAAIFSFFGDLSSNSLSIGFIAVAVNHIPQVFSNLPAPGTPFSGILRCDLLACGLILLLIEWPFAKITDAIHNASGRRYA